MHWGRPPIKLDAAGLRSFSSVRSRNNLEGRPDCYAESHRKPAKDTSRHICFRRARWPTDLLDAGATSRTGHGKLPYVHFPCDRRVLRCGCGFFCAQAKGKLEKVPSESYRFTEIQLEREIGVFPDDMEKVHMSLAKAGKNCFITNSVRTEVRVEPMVVPVVAEVGHH